MTGAAGALSIHRVAGAAMAERAVALTTDRLGAGAAPAGVAILARVNSALLPVQIALTEAGIPHTAPLDASVLGRTGVRTALAYLRLGLDLDAIRRDDLLDTINRPARKVKSAVVPLLPRANHFRFRQLEHVAERLDDTHRDRFDGYLADLRELADAIIDGADTLRCMRIVRDRIGLGEAMDALDASRTRPEGSSHGDDLDALEQLAALHPAPATFRTWLSERLRSPCDPTGVTLSTVHRVKGMEWDHVVVFAATQGLFPHRLADDVEEERRVFHVAVTRCRSSVAVVADRQRASPFVDELATARAARRPAPDSPGTTAATGPPAVEPVRRPDGAVVAAPGMEVSLAGGFTGRIVEVAADGAVALVGLAGAATPDGDRYVARIPFGQPVHVAGGPAQLCFPGAGTATSASSRPAHRDGARASSGPDGLDPAGTALFEALRAWRLRVASGTGVPAYLVFHDRHLREIAARRPASLRDLAACPGVGPTKLERYGDDVLDLVDAHR